MQRPVTPLLGRLQPAVDLVVEKEDTRTEIEGS